MPRPYICVEPLDSQYDREEKKAAAQARADTSYPCLSSVNIHILVVHGALVYIRAPMRYIQIIYGSTCIGSSKSRAFILRRHGPNLILV